MYQDITPQLYSGSKDWPATEHPLDPHEGQNPVMYTRCTGEQRLGASGNEEIGFISYYVPNPYVDGTGVADGDSIGVIGDDSTVVGGGGGGNAPHGTQYYIMQDTDGFVFVMLDTIELRGLDFMVFSCWSEVQDATWEQDDSIKIWIVDATGEEETVYKDYDMDDQAEAVWVEHTADISHLQTSATVMFGVEASSAAENVWFDWFQVTGHATEPFLAEGLVGIDTPDPCTSGVVFDRMIAGCTAPTAHNYKPWATEDDGGCKHHAIEMFDCKPDVSGALDLYNIILKNSARYLTQANPEICAAACLNTRPAKDPAGIGCLSFDYSVSLQRCYLNNGQIGVNGKNSNDTNWRYYERCE
jgi:hypothetical protein